MSDEQPTDPQLVEVRIGQTWYLGYCLSVTSENVTFAPFGMDTVELSTNIGFTMTPIKTLDAARGRRDYRNWR